MFLSKTEKHGRKKKALYIILLLLNREPRCMNPFKPLSASTVFHTCRVVKRHKKIGKKIIRKKVTKKL